MRDLSNVYFCEQRVFVNWAGWSQVQAIMAMLIAALNHPEDYGHIILITETDYPIWSNQEIEDYLEENRQTEFVLAYNCTKSPVKKDLDRIKHVWWFDWPEWNPFLHKWIRRIFNRTVFTCMRKQMTCKLEEKRVDVYFGQMLFAVTPKCAKHILKVYENDIAFNRYMMTTFAPCELYYQTIVFNSIFRSKTIQGGQEHTITPDFSWAPLHYYNYTGKIKIYTENDFKMLIECGYPFFRKAICGTSDRLMDMLDEYRNRSSNMNSNIRQYF